MNKDRKAVIWLAGIFAFGLIIHLFSSILLPFVVGMAIAYFLDPVADRMEAKGLSRGGSTCLILLIFFVAAITLLLLLIPLLQTQVIEFAHLVPKIVEAGQVQIQPYLEQLRANLSPDAMKGIREAAGTYAGKIANWLTQILAGLWNGGVAVFNVLSLIVITPIVAFYLLRDWDTITAKVDSWLPRPNAPTIREQLLAIDGTIAGFVRGQSTVCLVLAALYGISLTVIGLKSGLLLGIGAGLISFVPYLGAAAGMVVGVGIAIVQFPEWTTVAIVGAVFLFGQTLESYVLTPRLVGDRVGLHPVWIIFALLAGGAVMGFTGVLIAVPAAAVIGVLIRFSLTRYMASDLYSGHKDKNT
jgi:predicted PurR-regulated permease PerM